MARAAREKWKKIPGFSGYEASSLGRIRSYKPVNQYADAPKKPKLMKQRLGDHGYPRVTIQDDDCAKRVVAVHLLVARAFLGPARGRIVRHLDGDSGNPRLDNLAYGTIQENSDDKYEHGTHHMGGQNPAALLTEDEVMEIFVMRGVESQDSLAERFGVSRQAVSDIQRGVTWTEVTGG